ncbi:pca operon transcription factor PcaQ [Rhodobacteraceae bacterium RKSG542]|uniref:pca operon transcription factor PcaQ n=1 Tax=Pseudovibrio flavus TaxID=2529854 RepID=UPI0012BB5931|nr:pca operon transcription factor PcaQ [Pseudovibrio flavus]MTI18863.1 pca operon transcription factor PcaQ [Pseudovibrio flavus]
MNHLRRLKLRHLEAFVEVARQNSVSRAAKALNLTQPAVTRTLKELEEICGKPLLEKQGRGIKLSQFGEVFLRHAGQSLASARNGVKALTQLSHSQGPKVRIGALPTVAASVMPQAVKAYLDAGMRNRLHIVTGENEVLLNQLRNGDLDIVVGRLPAPEKMQGLTFEPAYRERVVFAVSASHPLAKTKQVSIQDLTAYPMLLPSAGSIIRPYVDRLFIEQGVPEPESIIETVSDSFGRAFANDYDAIWVISRGVIASEIASGLMIELPVETATTLGSVGLSVKAEGQLEPAAQLFAEIFFGICR